MRMDRPFANDHLDELTSCKWLSGGASLLQMMTWSNHPLTNDHPDGPASCKWLSGSTGLLQMIVWMDRPLANDPPFFLHYSSFQQKTYFFKYFPPFPSLLIFSFALKHIFLPQIYSSFSIPIFLLLQKIHFPSPYIISYSIFVLFLLSKKIPSTNISSSFSFSVHLLL